MFLCTTFFFVVSVSSEMWIDLMELLKIPLKLTTSFSVGAHVNEGGKVHQYTAKAESWDVVYPTEIPPKSKYVNI